MAKNPAAKKKAPAKKPAPKRARTTRGKLKADDKATVDINEAVAGPSNYAVLTALVPLHQDTSLPADILDAFPEKTVVFHETMRGPVPPAMIPSAFKAVTQRVMQVVKRSGLG